MNVQEIIEHYNEMKAARSVWETHWEEVVERVLPRYSQSFIGKPIQGAKRTEKVVDGTPALALETFAQAMSGMITPRNQRWHKLRASMPFLNKSANVLRYFDIVTDILFHYRYLPTANFDSQMFENYMGLGSVGTGCVYLDKNTEGEGFRYRAIHLSELFFDENHQGIIDVVHRRFTMKKRQIEQKFKQVPEKIRNGTDEKEYEIIHCVRPNDDRDMSRKDYKGMKYSSYYVCVDTKDILEEGGYNTFPYLISRYVTAPGEIYGRSPAMMVLPNIKVANEIQATLLEQGHRTLRPIILASDDGVIDTFSMRPGAIVPGGLSEDGRRLVDTLPTGRVDVGEKLLDNERSIIKQAFLVHVFQILLETPRMTATEVLQRAQDKAMLLTPTMGRQQTEMLGPMIERELDLLAEMGVLPPMPQELVEVQGEYAVVYDSPLSRAARAEEASGFMRTMEVAINLANAKQNPSSLDWLNEDTAIPDIAEITSVPSRWIRSQEEVDAYREERNKAMQTQQLLQAAPALASTVKSVGGAAQ